MKYGHDGALDLKIKNIFASETNSFKDLAQMIFTPTSLISALETVQVEHSELLDSFSFSFDMDYSYEDVTNNIVNLV